MCVCICVYVYVHVCVCMCVCMSSAASGMSLELCFLTQFQWREAIVLDNWCLALIAQIVRAFSMNPKVGVRVPPRSSHFLSQKLWHFHKNIRSCVENEYCCQRTVNSSNVNFTLLQKYVLSVPLCVYMGFPVSQHQNETNSQPIYMYICMYVCMCIYNLMKGRLFCRSNSWTSCRRVTVLPTSCYRIIKELSGIYSARSYLVSYLNGQATINKFLHESPHSQLNVYVLENCIVCISPLVQIMATS